MDSLSLEIAEIGQEDVEGYAGPRFELGQLPLAPDQLDLMKPLSFFLGSQGGRLIRIGAPARIRSRVGGFSRIA
jgi:hypothetical protein